MSCQCPRDPHYPANCETDEDGDLVHLPCGRPVETPLTPALFDLPADEVERWRDEDQRVA